MRAGVFALAALFLHAAAARSTDWRGKDEVSLFKTNAAGGSGVESTERTPDKYSDSGVTECSEAKTAENATTMHEILINVSASRVDLPEMKKMEQNVVKRKEMVQNIEDFVSNLNKTLSEIETIADETATVETDILNNPYLLKITEALENCTLLPMHASLANTCAKQLEEFLYNKHSAVTRAQLSNLFLKKAKLFIKHALSEFEQIKILLYAINQDMINLVGAFEWYAKLAATGTGEVRSTLSSIAAKKMVVQLNKWTANILDLMGDSIGQEGSCDEQIQSQVGNIACKFSSFPTKLRDDLDRLKKTNNSLFLSWNNQDGIHTSGWQTFMDTPVTVDLWIENIKRVDNATLPTCQDGWKLDEYSGMCYNESQVGPTEVYALGYAWERCSFEKRTKAESPCVRSTTAPVKSKCGEGETTLVDGSGDIVMCSSSCPENSMPLPFASPGSCFPRCPRDGGDAAMQGFACPKNPATYLCTSTVGDRCDDIVELPCNEDCSTFAECDDCANGRCKGCGGVKVCSSCSVINCRPGFRSLGVMCVKECPAGTKRVKGSLACLDLCPAGFQDLGLSCLRLALPEKRMMGPPSYCDNGRKLDSSSNLCYYPCEGVELAPSICMSECSGDCSLAENGNIGAHLCQNLQDEQMCGRHPTCSWNGDKCCPEHLCIHEKKIVASMKPDKCFEDTSINKEDLFCTKTNSSYINIGLLFQGEKKPDVERTVGKWIKEWERIAPKLQNSYWYGVLKENLFGEIGRAYENVSETFTEMSTSDSSIEDSLLVSKNDDLHMFLSDESDSLNDNFYYLRRVVAVLANAMKTYFYGFKQIYLDMQVNIPRSHDIYLSLDNAEHVGFIRVMGKALHLHGEDGGSDVPKDNNTLYKMYKITNLTRHKALDAFTHLNETKTQNISSGENHMGDAFGRDKIINSTKMCNHLSLGAIARQGLMMHWMLVWQQLYDTVTCIYAHNHTADNDGDGYNVTRKAMDVLEFSSGVVVIDDGFCVNGAEVSAPLLYHEVVVALQYKSVKITGFKQELMKNNESETVATNIEIAPAEVVYDTPLEKRTYEMIAIAIDDPSASDKGRTQMYHLSAPLPIKNGDEDSAWDADDGKNCTSDDDTLDNQGGRINQEHIARAPNLFLKDGSCRKRQMAALGSFTETMPKNTSQKIRVVVGPSPDKTINLENTHKKIVDALTWIRKMFSSLRNVSNSNAGKRPGMESYINLTLAEHKNVTVRLVNRLDSMQSATFHIIHRAIPTSLLQTDVSDIMLEFLDEAGVNEACNSSNHEYVVPGGDELSEVEWTLTILRKMHLCALMEEMVAKGEVNTAEEVENRLKVADYGLKHDELEDMARYCCPCKFRSAIYKDRVREIMGDRFKNPSSIQKGCDRIEQMEQANSDDFNMWCEPIFEASSESGCPSVSEIEGLFANTTLQLAFTNNLKETFGTEQAVTLAVSVVETWWGCDAEPECNCLEEVVVKGGKDQNITFFGTKDCTRVTSSETEFCKCGGSSGTVTAAPAAAPAAGTSETGVCLSSFDSGSCNDLPSCTYDPGQGCIPCVTLVEGQACTACLSLNETQCSGASPTCQWDGSRCS